MLFVLSFAGCPFLIAFPGELPVIEEWRPHEQRNETREHRTRIDRERWHNSRKQEWVPMRSRSFYARENSCYITDRQQQLETPMTIGLAIYTLTRRSRR